MALLVATDGYVRRIRDYLQVRGDALSLVWVRSDQFTDSKQVMGYTAHVVALLQRLRNEWGTRNVYLANSLPFKVLPLLAANLH